MRAANRFNENRERQREREHECTGYKKDILFMCVAPSIRFLWSFVVGWQRLSPNIFMSNGICIIIGRRRSLWSLISGSECLAFTLSIFFIPSSSFEFISLPSLVLLLRFLALQISLRSFFSFISMKTKKKFQHKFKLSVFLCFSVTNDVSIHEKCSSQYVQCIKAYVITIIHTCNKNSTGTPTPNRQKKRKTEVDLFCFFAFKC